MFGNRELSFRYTVGNKYAGQRIDVVLKALVPDRSRSALKGLLISGRATVNGKTVAPHHKVHIGDNINYEIPAAPGGPAPEDMPLSILHEDNSIIVVDKPAGLTVHPVRPQHGGTLVNALLAYTDELSNIGGVLRPGIVHRLDRDTSGVMVIARTNAAHTDLSEQFKRREVTKEYTAIIEGNPQLDADAVRMGVSRHARHPQKMAATKTGKEASATYEVIERFSRYALVRVRPRTGRTHQIRLMFSELGHPVAGDSAYGARKILLAGDLAGSVENPEKPVLHRQALHSSRLEFVHPTTGRPVNFEAALPADMQETVALLRGNCGTMNGVR